MIMKMLLDTHIVLWAIADTAKLSETVVKLLESKDNEVFYSVASVWEVAAFTDLCQTTGFVELPIKTGHIFTLKTLVRQETAPKHNDPFDRMLLAQAKYERLKFITHDSMLPYYEEDCIVRV